MNKKDVLVTERCILRKVKKEYATARKTDIKEEINYINEQLDIIKDLLKHVEQR